MTYFETPNDKAAWVLGISVERFEAMQDAADEDFGPDPDDYLYPGDFPIAPPGAFDPDDIGAWER